MQDILKNKYLRRSFWIASGSILLLLALIKILIVGEVVQGSPEWLRFLSGVLQALIASFITTAGIGAFIFYLTPKMDPKNGAEFLASYEFNDYFESALLATSEWHFRGGFGRYLRTTVLPRLNTLASEGRAPITVKAQILNPQNQKLCELHANLRNSVKNVDEKADWSSLDVKMNLYATIVACAIYESNNQYLDISVFLTNFFSTDRVDISSASGIVTKEDRKVPGIKFTKDSTHYKSYMGDLSVTQKQSDVVRRLPTKYKIGAISGDDVAKILKELDFVESVFTPENLKSIAKLVNEGKNPYA